MGGAFIAVADDATAAVMEPCRPGPVGATGVSVVGAGVPIAGKTNQFGKYPEASGAQSSSQANLNYAECGLSFHAAQSQHERLPNYQRLYDFSRNWNLAFSARNLPDRFRNTKRAGAFTRTHCLRGSKSFPSCPSASRSISGRTDLPQWLGYHQQGWQCRKGRNHLLGFRNTPAGALFVHGFNANIGVLWNITDKLTAGAFSRLPSTAELKSRNLWPPPGTTPMGRRPNVKTERPLDRDVATKDLDMPMSYGFGFGLIASPTA